MTSGFKDKGPFLNEKRDFGPKKASTKCLTCGLDTECQRKCMNTICECGGYKAGTADIKTVNECVADNKCSMTNQCALKCSTDISCLYRCINDSLDCLCKCNGSIGLQSTLGLTLALVALWLLQATKEAWSGLLQDSSGGPWRAWTGVIRPEGSPLQVNKGPKEQQQQRSIPAPMCWNAIGSEWAGPGRAGLLAWWIRRVEASPGPGRSAAGSTRPRPRPWSAQRRAAPPDPHGLAQGGTSSARDRAVQPRAPGPPPELEPEPEPASATLRDNNPSDDFRCPPPGRYDLEKESPKKVQSSLVEPEYYEHLIRKPLLKGTFPKTRPKVSYITKAMPAIAMLMAQNSNGYLRYFGEGEMI
ncbi:Bud site selection protein BUD4 [Frankliniella fusca]|uniref:Bud site selection protein BUD4 n=1 Tax=Frankliniella fusca TaxID=407009 RepID=A0AAE1LEN8_9NEOP|nr:Bud site selection protein BUD4 [Frankliniella fusca]